MTDYSMQIVSLLNMQPQSRSLPWEVAEEEIGSAIPADYKSLVNMTGAARIDEGLDLYLPVSQIEAYDIVTLVRGRDEVWNVARRWIKQPSQYFGRNCRLIAFSQFDGAFLYWRSKLDVPPDEWGVVIHGRDGENWHPFDMSATQCIYQILVGQIVIDEFGHLFERSEHEVELIPG